MRLAELQKEFMNAMQSGQYSELLQHAIAPHDKLSTADQLDIYKHSINENTKSIIAKHFPVCLQLVGEAFFNAMTEAYLQQQENRSHDLHELTQQFPAFIQSFKPADSLAYLSDVAQLEWFYNKAYDGPECVSFDLEGLAEISEQEMPRLKFYLQDNLYCLCSEYPVHEIYDWVTTNADYEIDLNNNQNYYIIITRVNNEVRIECIDEALIPLVQGIKNNLTLGDMVEHIHLLDELMHRNWLKGFVCV